MNLQQRLQALEDISGVTLQKKLKKLSDQELNDLFQENINESAFKLNSMSKPALERERRWVESLKGHSEWSINWILTQVFDPIMARKH